MATRQLDDVGPHTRRAAKGCRAIGGVAAVGSGALVIEMATVHQSDERVAIGVGAVVVAGLAAAYLTLAYHVVRRRLWAMIVAVTLSGLLGLYFSGVTAVLLYYYYKASLGMPTGAISFWAIVALYAALGAGLDWLVYQLARSFREMRRDAISHNYGFAVLPTAALPIAPVETEEDHGNGDQH